MSLTMKDPTQRLEPVEYDYKEWLDIAGYPLEYMKE